MSRSATLGNLTNAQVFHSFSTLNPGDVNQVLSGVSANGRELRIGFEDQLSSSSAADNDFQDICFAVKTDQDGLLVI